MSKEGRRLLIQQQFEQLRSSYPNFELCDLPGGNYEIIGMLHFIASYYDYGEIEDKYQICIAMDHDFPDSVPQVKEIDSRIPPSFHHYDDFELCLGTPSEIAHKFFQKKTLLDFVTDCVIPFFYAYSYFEIHNDLPWKDLEHGGDGILQHYKELFGLNDDLIALNFIKILSEHKTKGHNICPCGEEKIRNCKHGQELRNYAKGQQINSFKIEYLHAFIYLCEKFEGQIPYEFWNAQIRRTKNPEIMRYLHTLTLCKT